MSEIKFEAFPKIPRFFRDVAVTEKIDGTSATVFVYPTVTGALEMKIGSRNRWITPQNDNFSFAAWAEAHREELLKLGPGWHRGEWYGAGIQRGYGLTEKRFALFNPDAYPDETRPACCQVVPVLYRGPMNNILSIVCNLEETGSVLVPGFMKPEGVVIWHTAGRQLYKFTFDGDGYDNKNKHGSENK